MGYSTDFTSAAETGQAESKFGPESRDTPKSLTGVLTSHTSPDSASSQDPPQPSSRAVCAFDWLSLAVSGHFSETRFDELRASLQTLQSKAQETKEPVLWETSEGDIVQVLPHAIGKGYGRYRYAVKYRGMTIGIADSRAFQPAKPNVRIEIPGDVCLALGAIEALERVKGLLASLGYEWMADKITRLDECQDQTSIDPEFFRIAHAERRAICRARKRSCHDQGEVMEGVSYGKRGKGRVTARIYNKLLECAKSPDKLQMMVERRWGEQFSHAVRIEFEMSGVWLRKQFGVSSLDEYLAKRSAIVEYLCTEWLRIVGAVDKLNNNHQRAVLAPEWRAIVDTFARDLGRPSCALRPVRRAPQNVKAIVRQAQGCVSSIIAKISAATSFSAVQVMAEVSRMLDFERIAEDAGRKRGWYDALDDMLPPIAEVEIPF